MKLMRAADLFCGAGGTSQGLVEAATECGYDCELTAVNHWETAVNTHRLNHPEARHLCASLDALNPRDLFREGSLDLLWASPECTHHSIARGGRPVSDQSRATAWCVIRWAEALLPNVILVENVREFLRWGPCTRRGKAIKAKAGETFRAWVKCLESLGYAVDHRILCAADYGDPTSRRRLFVQAVRGRRQIRWPDPTHSGAWRTAREIIDWADHGQSIFDRRRPLADKTLRRIEIGLQKFGLKPFIAAWDHQSGSGVWGSDQPLSTVTTKARHGVAEPFLIKLRGTHESQLAGTARSVDQPVPTITAGGGHVALVSPFILPQQRGGRPTNSVDEPLTTVTCRGAHAVVQPFLVGVNHGNSGKPNAAQWNVHSLVRPFLVKYYGTGGHQGVDQPLDTVTTKPRFGLVRPVVELAGKRYLLDVHFRMLSPRELARAQGFHDTYQFEGTKSDVVRQIGNAVPRSLAKALAKAVLLGSA